MQRVGVFVCWCGSNIAATVDVSAVSEALKNEPGVVFSANYQYMCSQAGQDIAGLFGFRGLPFANAEAIYYLLSFLPLLLIGAVGATPLIRNTALRLQKKDWSWVLQTAAAALLLLICTAYLVDGSFSPFLYFRF